MPLKARGLVVMEHRIYFKLLATFLSKIPR